MAIAKLVARIEARYTQFDTRKIVRLTERAEKLALTNDERTVLLAFDDARVAAEEAQVEFTPTEEVVKQAEVIKAKLTKAEKAAKAAEKAIKAREIKVYRRKARIAAARYFWAQRTVSTTTIEPDGTETTVHEQVPVEVQEGVEDWKRLGRKVARFWTYPTDTFKRMWNWAKQPTDHIPAWRRPPVIVRKVVTAVAIAVLAVPVYVVQAVVNAAATLISIAAGLAMSALFALSLLVFGVSSVIAKIPFVGKWISLFINGLVLGALTFAGAMSMLLGAAMLVVGLLVQAVIDLALLVVSSPFLGYFTLKAKVAERKAVKAEVSQVETPVETPAEPVIEVVAEPVAPVVEEPVLEGVIIEPEAKPAPKPKAARRKRPVARPNVQVA